MAKGILTKADNGVLVLRLYMNGCIYGDYPIRDESDFRQLEDAVKDSKDYDQSLTIDVDGASIKE